MAIKVRPVLSRQFLPDTRLFVVRVPQNDGHGTGMHAFEEDATSGTSGPPLNIASQHRSKDEQSDSSPVKRVWLGVYLLGLPLAPFVKFLPTDSRAGGKGLAARVQPPAQHSPVAALPPAATAILGSLSAQVTPLSSIASNVQYAISRCKADVPSSTSNRTSAKPDKGASGRTNLKTNEPYLDSRGGANDLERAGIVGATNFYVARTFPTSE